jgi:hypothetical protein
MSMPPREWPSIRSYEEACMRITCQKMEIKENSYMNVRTGKKLRETKMEKKVYMQRWGWMRSVVRGGNPRHPRKEPGGPGTAP